MIRRLACVSMFAALSMSVIQAADEAPKSRMKDVLKARIAEDAKKADAKKSTPSSPSTAKSNEDAPPSPPPTPASPVAESKPAKPATSKAPTPPATILPKVEVRKDRITDLDQKLAKQEQDIASERKNLKTSETDAALNDRKIAGPLAIFGGESAQFRQRVAGERVELMEAEKDVIEAIARARTKEEKQELQKQLDQLRAFRRELDRSLR